MTGSNGRGASQAELKTRLRLYLKRSENKTCCDCNEKRPTWASIVTPPLQHAGAETLVVAFVCYTCSQAHKTSLIDNGIPSVSCTVKNVNSDICKFSSLIIFLLLVLLNFALLTRLLSFERSLTAFLFFDSVLLSSGSEEEVNAAKTSGNIVVNQFFEAALIGDLQSISMIKPSPEASSEFRERFVREKYIEGRFFAGKEVLPEASSVAIQQQPQQEYCSSPTQSASPRKRGSLIRFLKKENSGNVKTIKVKKASDCTTITADLTETNTMTETPVSDKGSIASFQMADRSCPQVQITLKSPPTLDDKEWDKVTGRQSRSTTTTLETISGSISSSHHTEAMQKQQQRAPEQHSVISSVMSSPPQSSSPRKRRTLMKLLQKQNSAARKTRGGSSSRECSVASSSAADDMSHITGDSRVTCSVDQIPSDSYRSSEAHHQQDFVPPPTPPSPPPTDEAEAGNSEEQQKTWWHLDGSGEYGAESLNQIQGPVSPPPRSPRKRRSFSKFLKKQKSPNSLNVSTKSAMTADSLPSVQITSTDDEDFHQSFGSRNSGTTTKCLQVQITHKKAPTLDDAAWDKVTRRTPPGRAQSERNTFNTPAIMGEMNNRLHQSDNDMEHPLQSDGEEEKPSFAQSMRKPKHVVDPKREAFQKLRSNSFLGDASSGNFDLLKGGADASERDEPNYGSINTGYSNRKLINAPPSTPSSSANRNSRVNLYSSGRRGRSSSRTRDNGSGNDSQRRTRSESRTNNGRRGESSNNRSRPRSSSRRRSSCVDLGVDDCPEPTRKRSSSRQKIRGRDDDNEAPFQTHRRGRSSSRRRSSCTAPIAPIENEELVIPDFIDLSAEPSQEEQQPSNDARSRRDLERSRSPKKKRKQGDKDKRLEAYRNGTESPMRSGGRRGSGREALLNTEAGGRSRGRSRSSSRRRSSTGNDERQAKTKSRSGSRRSLSRNALRATIKVDEKKKQSTKVPSKASKESRRARSQSRSRREEGATSSSSRPRRARSQANVLSNDDNERQDHVEHKKSQALEPGRKETLTKEKLTAAKGELHLANLESSGGIDDESESSGDFRIVAEASNPDFGDMSGFLGDAANDDSESFRKVYKKKKGGEEYIKEQRRGRRANQKNTEREQRKSGIFASLDREEDAVKTKLMRMSTTSIDPMLLRDDIPIVGVGSGSSRPLMMKGHVSLSGELAKNC